jgi:hypothetical protein
MVKCGVFFEVRIEFSNVRLKELIDDSYIGRPVKRLSKSTRLGTTSRKWTSSGLNYILHFSFDVSVSECVLRNRQVFLSQFNLINSVVIDHS